MKHKWPTFLSSTCINTPLGPMIALGDSRYLHLLEFIDNQSFEEKTAELQSALYTRIHPRNTSPLLSITSEVDAYFRGTLRAFSTPVHLIGTTFQKKSWDKLLLIPYGNTISYAKQATAIGNKNACRAVAHANSANRLAIIIPCHRVIKTDGSIGGYNSGIDRKRYLLCHETDHADRK